jgi:hypothetical protein
VAAKSNRGDIFYGRQPSIEDANRVQHGELCMKIFVHSTRVRLYVFWDYLQGLQRFYSARRRGKMPPKKKEEEKLAPLMGRIGTSLKCGIVGLPNVGLVFLYSINNSVVCFCVCILVFVTDPVVKIIQSEWKVWKLHIRNNKLYRKH